MIVRGNYSHHNYRGGWSQGFNMVASGVGANVLIEHNVFRGSSWNVQDVAGEFRYNLVYGYGHTWLRSGNDGAAIHHNVFAPEQGGGESDQGIWLYSGEKNVQIYNNTFDGGGDAVAENFAIGSFPFTGPVVQISNDSHVTSLRNNLMTFTTNFENSAGNPHVVGDASTFGTVDYNAFYSPDNDTRDNYAISGKSEGVTAGFAAHDVSGSGALRREGRTAVEVPIRRRANFSVRDRRRRSRRVESHAIAIERPRRIPRALHARGCQPGHRCRRSCRQRLARTTRRHRRDRCRWPRSRPVRQIRAVRRHLQERLRLKSDAPYRRIQRHCCNAS